MINIEQEYKDWVALLKKTGNESLLNDPYNVWLEAFSIAIYKLSKEKTPVKTGEAT